MNVIVALYKPDVRCNSLSGPPLDSCISIFSNMRVDKNRQMFGHLPDQRVQVELPITYTSSKISGPTIPLGPLGCLLFIADRRCMVRMDIRGPPTRLTLYEVWEAIVALTSTCVRGNQRCGKASGLGLHDRDRVQAGSANTPRHRPQHIPSIV